MDTIVKRLMENHKVNESYSPDLLSELVAFYAPRLQFGGETLGSIWDEIVSEHGDEDLANDVIEALENEDVYESNTPEETSVDSVSKLFSTSMDEPIEYAKILRAAVEDFKRDYRKIPSGMNGLSIDYDEAKRHVYRTYKPLADECKRVLANMKISGYGRMDAVKVEIKKLCDLIDYNFPYGWKNV